MKSPVEPDSSPIIKHMNNNIVIVKNAVKQMYRWFMILITLVLFVIVAYNVIRRYIFNNSIAWADELARFMFIWLNLLGMISVFQNNELIGLDIFTSVIIDKTKYGKIVFMLIEFIAVAIVLGVLTYYSLQFLSIMRHVSATLALPMRFVYSVLPISMICMFIGNTIKFITAILEYRNN